MIARLNDIEIYYEILGKGEPLVMIEGLGYSSWMWEFQRSLSQHVQLVIYDNRGVGGSSKPEEPYTMDDLVMDLYGLVNYLGIREFYLLGVSMGGMIAQEFSLRYGIMVKGLILSSTNYGVKSVLPSPDIMKILTTPLDEATVMERMKPAFSPTSLKEKKDLIDKIIDLRIRHETRVMQLQQANAVAGFDSFDRLKSMHIPTLLITGEDDNVIPPVNSETMYSVLPKCKLVKLKDAGHLVNMERPEVYNNEIVQFIQQVSGGQFNPSKSRVVK